MNLRPSEFAIFSNFPFWMARLLIVEWWRNRQLGGLSYLSFVKAVKGLKMK